MAEVLPAGVFNVVCGDRDTGRALGGAPGPRDGLDHRLGARGHGGGRDRRRRTSSVCTWNWAARPRSSSSTTSTSPRPRRTSPSRATSTPARTAPRRRACSSGPGVYGDFVDALAEQASNTVIGPPDNDDALFGPVNNVNQFERVTGFSRRAPKHASSWPAAHQVGTEGFFIAPDRRRRACIRTTR